MSLNDPEKTGWSHIDPVVSKALQLLQEFPPQWDEALTNTITEMLRPYSLYSNRLEKFQNKNAWQTSPLPVKTSVQTAQIGISLIHRADRLKVASQLIVMVTEIVSLLRIYQAYGLPLQQHDLQRFLTAFIFEGPQATRKLCAQLEQTQITQAS